MKKFMENCYKKVEGFLDSCGKFFATEEDAWVSDAARALQKEYNSSIPVKFSPYETQYKEMSFDQAQRVVRKALEFAQSKGCRNRQN